MSLPRETDKNRGYRYSSGDRTGFLIEFSGVADIHPIE